ncbi:response regulator [Paenibacillus sp. V4I7]|uniref:response regulator n=1 Tax=Paenibacillus sp. V4I7 TaxID=3042307 RepID=UPI00277D8B44|nr:response regulator [Paenibacillus sp. V4I7]MDQ0897625.1 two-component system response regulator YesN [Paenibacillus sp. V4I7]
MEQGRITAIAVDDEVNPRKLLQVLLDWHSLGIEFIGEASNGNEALDLIDAVRPNIVFTDINMPYMDGLELAKQVRERDPFIKVVILTAYPEFEYAKQSVKIGVHDFLLKPLQPDVLRKLAVDLKEVIEKETVHWNEYRKIQTELLENTLELKEKFLMDLLVGTSSNGEQLNRRFDYFFGESLRSCFSVAILDFQSEPNVEEERRLNLSMGCKRAVEFLVHEREGIHVLQDNGGRVVMISWDKAIELESLGEQAIRIIKDKLGCQATVGVGGVCNNLPMVKKSYKEALEALRYGKLFGGDQVISFGEDIRLVNYSTDLKQSDTEEIIFFIKTGLKDQAVKSIDKLFQSLEPSDGTANEHMYSLGVHFISMLNLAMSELGFTQLRSNLLNGALYNRMFGCRTTSDLSQFLSKLAEDTADYVQGTRMKKTNQIVRDILAYLTDEFRNPEVSLGSVSQKFHLNSSYLSRIFKQEIGQGFTDYLLKLRIDEAVKLMNEADWKAYQIAEKVGIKDPYYFSHRFKKVTGVSIQEYKRTSQK